MKIRKGFVSNSSSSSFCIIGVEAREEPMEILKNILKINNEDIFAEMSAKSTTDTVEEFCRGWLEEELEERDIETHYINDDCLIIGNYVANWEYECSTVSAQAEFDKAKEIVEQLGLSAEDLKIFLGTSYC